MTAVGSSSTQGRKPAPRSARAFVFAALCAPVAALAGPEGGQIVGGAGSIDVIGATTQVNQATQAMAIDWNSFNVAAGEAVQFIQPNTSAVVLNRILDQNPSQIFGRIDANGNVFLLNARGVIFGETAQINVGSLMAAGLDMSTEDFMAGRYNLAASGLPGAVINHGVIAAATGGSVVLAGGQVLNTGTIRANYGRVTMAGAEAGYVDFDGDGLMRFEVTGELQQKLEGADAAVTNSGVIQVAGGEVVLEAHAARGIFDTLVNNEGVIEAAAIDTSGGQVRLVAVGGDVVNTGTIDVSSVSGAAGTVTLAATDGKIVNTGAIRAVSEQASAGVIQLAATNGNIESSGDLVATSVEGAGGTILIESNADTLLTAGLVDVGSVEAVGGTIHVLGDRVAVMGPTRLGSTGGLGGGVVLIGGDFQGRNLLVRNARQTYVGPDVQIDVSAINAGTGGRVIAWSDEYTRFFGTVSARGPPAGAGGFVEVSSKGVLAFNGLVDTTAFLGTTGTLLLDPTNIEICDLGGCSEDVAASGTDPITFSDATSENPSQLDRDTLQTQLASTSVIVSTASASADAGNITVEATVTWNNSTSLTLLADGGIDVNNAITNNGTGNLILTGGSAGTISIDAAITLAGGSFSASAGSYTQANVDVVTGAGAITVTANTVALTANTTNNAFQTSGTLTLKPLAAATAMSLASGTPATFDLTAAEVTDLSGGASTIVIGDAANANAGSTMTVGGAVSFGAKPVTLNAASFADGDTTANVITAGSLSLNATAGAIGGATNNNAIDVAVTNLAVNTAGGDAYVTSTAGFTVNGSSSAGALSLASAGTIAFAGSPNITAGTLTLTADDVDTLDGIGALAANVVVQPDAAADTIGLAVAVDGTTFALTANDITELRNGTGTVTIGRSGGTGAVTIEADVDFTGKTVVLRSGQINEATDRIIASSLELVLSSGGAANTVRTEVGTLILNSTAGTDATGESVTVSETDALILGTTNLNAGTLTLSPVGAGSVTQSGVVTAGTLVATLGAASALTLNTQTNAISSLGAITAPGGVSLTNGTSLTVTGLVSTTDTAVSINVGTGTYTQNDVDVTAGNGAITITADGINIVNNTLDNAFQTTGTLTLKPFTAAEPMSFVSGAATVDDFDLSLTEITDLTGASTPTTIVIGDSAASTGTLTISGAVNLSGKTLTLHAGSFTDGATAGNTITATSLTLNGRTGAVGTGAANGAIDVAVTTLVATSTGAANGVFINGSVTNLGAITAPGGFTLTNGNNPVTVTAAIGATDNAVSINVGTGTYTQNNVDVTAGNGAITITADGINIVDNTDNNAFQTTGTLTLKPFTAAEPMSFVSGAATTDDFDLSLAEIADLTGTSTPTTIVIGDSAASTGTLTISGAVNLSGKTLTLHAGSFTDGATAGNAITAGSLTLNGRTGAVGTSAANDAIDVAVTTLVATSTGAANGVFINGSVTNLGAITAPGGFTLTNGNNPVTVTANVTTTNNPISISVGTNNYTQNAGADLIAGNGAITIIADSIAIVGNTTNNAFQTSGTLTLRPSSATVAMSLAGTAPFDLTATEVTDLAGGVTGTIVIGNSANTDAGSTMTVGGAVSFGTKTVTLHAVSFGDSNSTGNTITAGSLTLNATAGAVGGSTANNAIDVAVTTLAATSTSGGGVFINGSVANLGAITAPGGFTLTNNNPVTVTAAISTTDAAISINVGTATYTQNDVDISSGAGAITVIADGVAIGSNGGDNAFQTSGTLTLRPSTTVALSLGSGGAPFDLTAAEITELAGGVTGTIVIGNPANASALSTMTIGAAVDFGSGKTVVLHAASFGDGNTTTRTITAGSLSLNATNGTIGNTGNDAIDVIVTTLELDTTAANGAFVSESGGGYALAASTVGGTLSLVAGGSVTQSGAVSATTLTATLTGGTSALSLNTQTNAIANLGAITAPGGFSLTNGSTSLTVGANINTTTNAISINVGAGTYTQNDFDLDTNGTGGITITADTIAIVNNTNEDAFQSTGTLTLKPFTAGQTMELGGAAVNGFALAAAEISEFTGAGSATTIVIGDSATGALTIINDILLSGTTLTLNAASISDGNTTTRPVEAASLTLNAFAGSVGGSGNNAIDTTVTNLSGSASDSFYAIDTSGVAVGLVTATNTASITATGSSITDQDGSNGTDVTAATILLTGSNVGASTDSNGAIEISGASSLTVDVTGVFNVDGGGSTLTTLTLRVSPNSGASAADTYTLQSGTFTNLTTTHDPGTGAVSVLLDVHTAATQSNWLQVEGLKSTSTLNVTIENKTDTIVLGGAQVDGIVTSRAAIEISGGNIVLTAADDIIDESTTGDNGANPTNFNIVAASSTVITLTPGNNQDVGSPNDGDIDISGPDRATINGGAANDTNATGGYYVISTVTTNDATFDYDPTVQANDGTDTEGNATIRFNESCVGLADSALCIYSLENDNDNNSGTGVTSTGNVFVTVTNGDVYIFSTDASAVFGTVDCTGGTCRGVYDIGTGTVSITAVDGHIYAFSSGTAPEISVNSTGNVILSSTDGDFSAGGGIGSGPANTNPLDIIGAAAGTGTTLPLTLTLVGAGDINVRTSNVLKFVSLDPGSLIGSMTFTADEFDFSLLLAAVTVGDGATVTLAPYTAGRAIDVGTDTVASTLGLTSTQLALFDVTGAVTGTIAIGNTSSGAITVSDAITRTEATNFTLTTGVNNNIAFTGTAGSLSANGGNVTLTVSGTGTVTSVGTAVNDVIAAVLTVNTATGGIGTSTDPLLTSVNQLTTTASSGDQYITEANDLGELNLNAGTGDILLTLLDGSVADTDGGIDVTADDFQIDLDAAAGGFGNAGAEVETSIAGIEGTVGTGGLHISDANGFEVGDATGPLSGITSTGGVTLTALADESILTISQPVSGTSGTFTADEMVIGNTLTFTGGTLTLKPETSGPDAISLHDAGAVPGLGDVLELSDTELAQIAATTLIIGATSGVSALSVADTLSLGSITNLTLSSAANITFSGSVSVSGQVTLNTVGTGTITSPGSETADVTAASLVISAGSGTIGTSTADRLNFAVAALTTSGTGTQFLRELNGLTDLSLTATGSSVDLVVEAGGITDTDSGGDLVDAVASSVTILLITANQSVGADGVGALDTQVGSLSVTTSGTGDQYIVEADGLTDLALDAGSTAGSLVKLTVTTGGVSDTAGDGEGLADVVAAGAEVSLSQVNQSFGTSGADTIDTSVDALTVTTSGTGDQFIRELNGLTDLKLDAGSTAGAEINLTLVLGSVLDSADNGVTDGVVDGADLIAPTITVSLPADGSLGSSTYSPITLAGSSNTIETTADVITATTSGGGGLFITESDGLSSFSLSASTATGAIRLFSTTGSLLDTVADTDATAFFVGLYAAQGSIGTPLANLISIPAVRYLELVVGSGLAVQGDNATGLSSVSIMVNTALTPAAEYQVYDFGNLNDIDSTFVSSQGLDHDSGDTSALLITGVVAFGGVDVALGTAQGHVYLDDGTGGGGSLTAVTINGGGDLTITASAGHIFDRFTGGGEGGAFNNIETVPGTTLTFNAPTRSVGQGVSGAATDIDVDLGAIGTVNLVVNAASSNVALFPAGATLSGLSLTVDPTSGSDIAHYIGTNISIDELCAAGHVCINQVHNGGTTFNFSLTALNGDIIIGDYHSSVLGAIQNIGDGTVTLTAQNGGIFGQNDSPVFDGTTGARYHILTSGLITLTAETGNTSPTDSIGTTASPIGVYDTCCASGGIEPVHLVLNRTGTGAITIGANSFNGTQLDGFSSTAAGSTTILAVASLTLDSNVTQSGTLAFQVFGTLIVNGVTVTSTAASADAITFEAVDLDVRAGSSVVASGSGGGIRLYTSGVGQSIEVGGSGSANYNVSDAELLLLTTFDVLTIGESGSQTGTVTLVTVAVPVADGNLIVNADAGSGTIVLNDQGAAGGPALSGTSGNVTLNAVTISALNASGTTAEDAEISIGGTVTLTASGAIGSPTNQIQFSANQDDVVITNAPLGAYLNGLGNLTLAAITTGGGELDVRMPALFTLTLGGAVALGAGNLTLESSEIDLNISGGSIVGSGTVRLQPVSDGFAIVVGGTADSGAATLDITDGDIAELAAGFTEIIIGRDLGTHVITVVDAVFLDLVRLQAPKAGGSIIDDGTASADDDVLDLTAPSANLDAADGIGQGATGSLDTDIDNLSANSSGNIAIRQTGDVTIGLISAGAGDVTLTVVDGSIASAADDGGADISGATITLALVETGAGERTIGASSADRLEVNAQTLNASTQGNSAGDDIFLTDVAGGLAVGAINAGVGDVTLSATGGAIADDGTAGVDDNTTDFTAATLTLSAGVGGIGQGATGSIDTAVDILNVTGTGGNVSLRETGDVAVGAVSAAANNVSLTATGAITDDGTGGVDDNTTDITAGTLSLNAGTGIGQGATGSLDTAVVTLNASSTTGGISVRETGDVAIGTIGAGTDAVSLIATGAITDDGTGGLDDNTTDITAGTLGLSAGTGGIGQGATGSLDTDVVTLDVTGTGGNVSIRDAGDVAIGAISGAANTVTLTAVGAITDDGTGGVDDNTTDITAGTLALNAGTGGIGQGATGSLDTDVVTLNVTGTGGNVSLRDAGDVAIGAISAGANTVTLTAFGAITDDGTGGVDDNTTDITASTLTLNAGVGGIGQGVTGSLDTAVDIINVTGAGTGVTLRETGDFAVGSIGVGANPVTLTATGAITDDGTGGVDDNLADITAGALVLNAGTGIGQGATGSLDTSVNTLTVSNTAGNVSVREGGDVAIVTITAAGQIVSLTATGAITDDGTGGVDDNTTDVTAATLTLNAGSGGAGGIGQGATGSLDTDVVTLNVTGTGGNVSIRDAADVAVGAISAAANTVTLTAIGAITDDGTGGVDDNTTDITAGTLTLNAGAGGIGQGATGSLDTDIVTLNVTGTGGNVSIRDAGSVAVGAISAGANTVTLTAVTGITDDGTGGVDDNTTDITAGTLSLNAGAGGIGQGATGSLDTDVVTLDVTGTGGNVAIRDAGSVAVGTIAGGANSVTLTAVAAITDDGTGGLDDNTTDITASTLTLNAGTGIGQGATGSLDTAVTTLNAGSTSGGISVAETGDVAIGSVNAAGQTVQLVATGAITNVADYTTAPMLVGDVDVTAATLLLSAATGIQLDTAVDTIDFASGATQTLSGAGNIDIDEFDGVTLNNLTTTSGNIAVDAAQGAVGTLNATVVTAGGAGNITLRTASGGDILVANVAAADDDDGVGDVTTDDTIDIIATGAIDEATPYDFTADLTADTVNLTAGTGVGQTDAPEIDADSFSVNNSGNDISLSFIGDSTIVGGVNNTAPGGSITLQTIDGDLNTGTGGIVTDNGDITLIAVDLTLETPTNDQQSVTVGSGGLSTVGGDGAGVGTDGNIIIRAGDDVILSGNVNAGAGTVEISADYALLDDGPPDIFANPTADGDGSIEDNGAAALITGSVVTLNASEGIGTTDPLDLAGAFVIDAQTAAGALDLNHDASSLPPLTTVLAFIDVTGASGSITFDQTGAQALQLFASTADGAITVTNAGAPLTASSVISSTDDDANDISLTAAGIAVDFVDAGTTAGDVTLDAGAGSISDANGAGPLNVTAEALLADAAGGIDLDTTVNAVDASVTGPGNLTLRESDAITLTDVDTANGSIFVQAGGTITATDVASLTDDDLNDISLLGVGIEVGVVNAGTTAGDVLLDAGSGAITDVSGGEGAGNENVVADAAQFVSTTGIGDNTAAGDLDTAVNSLDVTVTAGSAYVTETDGVDLAFVSIAGAAEDLVLFTGGAITNSGDIFVGDAAQFDSAGNAITLGGAAVTTDFGTLTFNGSTVSISEDSDTVLAGVSSATDLTLLDSAGSITDGANGDLTVTNTANLSAASIDLGDTGVDGVGETNFNDTNFGALTFNSAGAVSIVEDSATDLAGSSSAGTLALQSADALTDQVDADLSVVGNAALIATSIDLGDVGTGLGVNDTTFGSLTFSAGSVAIREDDRTDLSGASSASSLTLYSAGTLGIGITDDPATDPAGTVSVTGLTTLSTEPGNSITLDNNNAFSTVESTALNGVVTLTDVDAIDLGLTSAASLVVTAGGAITDSAVLTLTTSASFTTLNDTAGVGTITLDDDGTDPLANALPAITARTLNAAGTAAVASDITILSDGPADLALIETDGNLIVLSAGAITDSGTIAVGGNATFTGASIGLGGPAESTNFGTLTFVSGGVVQIQEDSTMDLAGASSAGFLGLAAAGIDDGAAGTVTVTVGGTILAAGANDILLDNANDFIVTGPVTVVSANDVTLNDVNAITLGNVTTSDVGLDTGDLLVTAGGDITDAGDLVIAGHAHFDAGFNSITLGSSGEFTTFGSLSFTGGSVSIEEDDSTDLFGPSSAGTLSLVGLGIDDGTFGTLAVTGTATISAGANNITLNNGNDFGTLALTSNSADVQDINNIQLGASTLQATLFVFAGGTITDIATLSVVGTATFFTQNPTAGAGEITLDDDGDTSLSNTFGSITAVALDGSSDIVIREGVATNLALVQTSGALTVESFGAITDSGTLSVGGPATFITRAAAGSGSITLDDNGDTTYTNSLGSVTARTLDPTGATVVASDIVLHEGAATDLALVETGGSLTVSSPSGITDSGNIDVALGASFTVTAGSIVLGDAGETTNFGTLTLNAPVASVGEDSSTEFAGVSNVPNLTLVSGGAITDGTTASVVSALASLAAGANPITLDNAGLIDFGTLSIPNAGTLTLVDTGGLDFGNVALSGNMVVTAGSITDSGTMTVGGTTTLSSPGAIDLGGAPHDFVGLVDVTAGGDLTLRDGNDLLVGEFGAANVTLTAGGAVLDGNDFTEIPLGSGNFFPTDDDPGAANITTGNLTLVANAVGTGVDIITATNRLEVNVGGDIVLTGGAGGIFLDSVNPILFSKLTINPSTGVVNILAESFTVDRDIGDVGYDLGFTARSIIRGGDGIITADTLYLNALNLGGRPDDSVIGTIADPVKLDMTDPAGFEVPQNPSLNGFGFVNDSGFSGEDFNRVFSESGDRIFVIGDFTDLIASVQGSFITAVGFTIDASQFRTDLNIVGMEGAGFALPVDQCEDEESADCAKL